MTETITAPFTMDQAVDLQEWQSVPWTDKLTCKACPSMEPLVVEQIGLRCASCYAVQTEVDASYLTLPPDPSLAPLKDFTVTMFLAHVLPSGEHRFIVKATDPVQALAQMLVQHPDALLPFTIREGSDQ